MRARPMESPRRAARKFYVGADRDDRPPSPLFRRRRAVAAPDFTRRADRPKPARLLSLGRILPKSTCLTH